LKRLRARDGDDDGHDYEQRSRRYQRMVREILEDSRLEI